MRLLGRTLQVFGLILLPVGFLYGTTSGREDAIRVEIAALAAGALAFFAGTAIVRRG
jgi:hypothetical protein